MNEHEHQALLAIAANVSEVANQLRELNATVRQLQQRLEGEELQPLASSAATRKKQTPYVTGVTGDGEVWSVGGDKK